RGFTENMLVIEQGLHECRLATHSRPAYNHRAPFSQGKVKILLHDKYKEIFTYIQAVYVHKVSTRHYVLQEVNYKAFKITWGDRFIGIPMNQSFPYISLEK